MKNPFKPFTSSSILLALGITLFGALVAPVIKEILTSYKEQNTDLFKLHTTDEDDFSMNKSEI